MGFSKFLGLTIKLATLSDIFFPKKCVICHIITNNYLCAECIKIASPTLFFCRHCGVDLPASLSICGRCISNPTKIIDHLIIPFLYQNIISELVIDLKFNKNPLSAKVLSYLVEQAGTYSMFDNLDMCEAQIIPIPVDRFRLGLRGFNQSLLLANEISKVFCNENMFINYTLLHKKVGFVPQSTLNKADRQKNIKGAFVVNQKQKIPKTVLLVDDVFTTGSTLFAAAAELKKAGVKNIYALIVSKA